MIVAGPCSENLSACKVYKPQTVAAGNTRWLQRTWGRARLHLTALRTTQVIFPGHREDQRQECKVLGS